MCFTLRVFYCCRDLCLGGDARKRSILRGGRSYPLDYIHVCPRVKAGKSCIKPGPRDGYEFTYPLRCAHCQVLWADLMTPSVLEKERLKDRLEDLYGGEETEDQIDERALWIVDDVEHLVATCNVELQEKEAELDVELEQIMWDINQAPGRLDGGQQRLDNTGVGPVDYDRYEADRTQKMEKGTGWH